MSYDVELRMPDGSACKVGRHEEGGTYVIGGREVADLNITYNYYEVYQLFDFSINQLHRQRIGDWIEKMDVIVTRLGTEQFKDYWAPTPGNAGYALNILLGWARQYPDAIVDVS